MPLRTRIFIILSIIILVILAISIFLYMSAKNKNDKIAPTATTTANNIQLPGGSNIPSDLLNSNGSVNTTKVVIQQPTTEEVDKNASKQLAKVFTERFGSYSSDSNYQNIKDVQAIVSDNLWSALSSLMKYTAMAQEYNGVTSEVISVKNDNWTSGAAKYTLSTVRATSHGDATKISHQDIEVNLIKSNGSWLVDGYIWK